MVNKKVISSRLSLVPRPRPLTENGSGPEEVVGHIIICTALRQSLNTWPLQPAESADHNLPTSKTIHTDVIRNVRLIIIQ